MSLTRALKTIPVGQHVRPFWTCEIVACIPLQNSVALYVFGFLPMPLVFFMLQRS